MVTRQYRNIIRLQLLDVCAINTNCQYNNKYVTNNDVLCQDWLKDVLRRGVASATDAVH